MNANTPNNNNYNNGYGAGGGFNDTKSNNDLGVSIEYSVMEHYNVNKSVYGVNNNDDSISGYGAKSEFVARSPKPGAATTTIDI